jgi:serine/threonine protein phosphatase PrpC
VRARNEDAMLVDDRRGLWAVADGMGGHAGGAEASAAVIAHLRYMRTGWRDPRALAEDLIARLEDAHAAIRAANAGGAVSGSTVACLAVFAPHALVTWCGDSRVYSIAPRAPLRRITRDHTLVQQLVEGGMIAEAEVETHPQAHVLTRAVGATERLELDFEQLRLTGGDRFLLCSDGLTRVAAEPSIAEALQECAAPERACERLLELARRGGAPDNVTAIVVDLP